MGNSPFHLDQLQVMHVACFPAKCLPGNRGCHARDIIACLVSCPCMSALGRHGQLQYVFPFPAKCLPGNRGYHARVFIPCDVLCYGMHVMGTISPTGIKKH